MTSYRAGLGRTQSLIKTLPGKGTFIFSPPDLPQGPGGYFFLVFSEVEPDERSRFNE